MADIAAWSETPPIPFPITLLQKETQLDEFEKKKTLTELKDFMERVIATLQMMAPNGAVWLKGLYCPETRCLSCFISL